MTAQESVTVYGKPGCKDTHRSRTLLDSRGVAYEYFDILADEAARTRAEEASGSTRAPVIIVGGSRVLVEPTDEDLTDAISSAR